MGDFFLVRQALLERQLLLRLMPRLVHPMPFVFPIFAGGPAAGKVGIGLTLYDAFARMTLSTHAAAMPAHRRLTGARPRRCCRACGAGLLGGFVYYDAVTDDARLTIEILKAAAGLCAVPANRCRVVELLRRGGRDRSAGAGRRSRWARRRDVRGAGRPRGVGGGAWAGDFRPTTEAPTAAAVRPSKGAHVVVPGAGAVPHRSADPVPRLPPAAVRHSLAGGDPAGHHRHRVPRFSRCGGCEFGRYELHSVGAERTPAGVAAKPGGRPVDFAGLRPLADRGGAGPTTNISRKHVVRTDADGVVSITGGKLTTCGSSRP